MSIADRILQSGRPLNSLSSSTGIPERRLSELASGAEASLDELKKLALALNLRLTDFIPDRKGLGNFRVLFRKAAKAANEGVTGAIDACADVIARALQILDQAPSVDQWIGRFKIDLQTYDRAQDAALEFRSIFLNGDDTCPILNLADIVSDEIGIIIMVIEKQKFDGASAFFSGFPFVFLSPRFKPRMLFTLAHEVGHLLFHHDSQKDFAVFDSEEKIGVYKKAANLDEYFTDAFASCLLLPPAGVGRALKAIRNIIGARSEAIGDLEILYLSHVFGVSFQVAARRCEDLKLLPRGGAHSLYEKLVKEFGGPERRAEQAELPPRPDLDIPRISPILIKATLTKIRDGALSIGEAARLLDLPQDTLLGFHAKAVQ